MFLWCVRTRTQVWHKATPHSRGPVQSAQEPSSCSFFFFSFSTFLDGGQRRALSLRRRESTFVLAFSKRTREQAFLSTGGAVHVQSNTGSNTAIWATHPNVGDFTPRRDPVKHEQTHLQARTTNTYMYYKTYRHIDTHIHNVHKETLDVF